MKSTAKILGIVSFVINLIACVLVDLIVFTAERDWTFFIIAVAVELLFLSLSLFLAIKSPKSKGCCIGLILIGVFTLFIFGILNIIGGAIGLGNFNAAHSQSAPNVSSGSYGAAKHGNGAEEPLFDSTVFSGEKKYYYPVNEYNLFDLVLNFRNAPEISVRFDDMVLPLKIRLYINYGETVEDQTVAGFEVMSRFDLPMEKRTLIFQIVKDEQGKSALYWLRSAEDQELIKKVQNDTKRLFNDVNIGEIVEDNKFNIRYGLDERIGNKESKQGNNETAITKESKRNINVGGTVLAVLSVVFFAVAIVCIVLLACRVGQSISPLFVNGMIFCLLGFVICGVIGHWIADDPCDGFAYYATFLTFWLVYGVIYLVKEFIKNAEASPSPPKTETVYYVYDKKYYGERELRQVEAYCEDYRYFVGKRYNRFKDDLGDYWRSYDGNKTFIREDNLS